MKFNIENSRSLIKKAQNSENTEFTIDIDLTDFNGNDAPQNWVEYDFIDATPNELLISGNIDYDENYMFYYFRKFTKSNGGKLFYKLNQTMKYMLKQFFN